MNHGIVNGQQDSIEGQMMYLTAVYFLYHGCHVYGLTAPLYIDLDDILYNITSHDRLHRQYINALCVTLCNGKTILE